MPKAVLFDLDNTLVDRNAAFESCVRASFGNESARREIIAIDAGGFGDRNLLFSSWRKHSGATMNQGLLGEMLAARIHPDPTILHVLKNLCGITKAGVVSNGSGTTQRQKLKASGMDQLFGLNVWISEEVGFSKPDPRIFKVALHDIGEPPESCLYIGDREEVDALGARSAGMRARIVNRVLTGVDLSDLIDEEFGK
jgi:HAD superfamily hydrolase (TIGR01509 family)